MSADILVVGQGLAGTMLAWELERTGVPFELADAGYERAASAVAAGIINPITGRRLVKSWRVDTLLPTARAAYREFESALGVTLWRDMRVRRVFVEERERRVFGEKSVGGELEPYTHVVRKREPADDEGFWIEGAARIDLTVLLRLARLRWQAQGRLRTETVDVLTEVERHELVIDCSGTATAQAGAFAFVPWEFSKGEVLEIAIEGLAPDVILNRGHWVMPFGPGTALIGATHEPGVVVAEPTEAARATLMASADVMLGRTFQVTGQRAGIRVNLPDKRPVVGRHPEKRQLGVINGLGAKGTLLAPALAQQWVRHLREGVPFDPEWDVGRWISRP